MKSKWLLSALLLSFGMYAQQKSNTVNAPEDFNFKSKSVTFDQELKTMTFSKDAHYKDAIIEVKGAEEIIFDQVNKEIIAIGNFDFKIDGVVQMSTGATLIQKLKYKIGEAKVYIE